MKNKNTFLVHINSTEYVQSTKIVLSMCQLTFTDADQHFRSWVKFGRFKLFIIILCLAIQFLVLMLYGIRGSETSIA